MKRMTTLCVGIAAAIALSGCATKEQLDVTNGQLNVIQIQLSVLNKIAADAAVQLKKEPGNTTAQEACLLAGQPYSEGAVAAGRICKRVHEAKADGALVPPSTLAWFPESSIRVN